MTAAVGFPTLRLVRTRIGDWSLDDLQPGEYRELHVPDPAPGTARSPHKKETINEPGRHMSQSRRSLQTRVNTCWWRNAIKSAENWCSTSPPGTWKPMKRWRPLLARNTRRNGLGCRVVRPAGYRAVHRAGQWHYLPPHYFSGQSTGALENALLDPDIHAVHWLDYEEILANSARMRSPLVLASIELQRRGICYPLDLIYSHEPELCQ